MAKRSSSNVVPFAAQTASPAEALSLDAAQLLALCRDRLAHGVATAFAENMGKAKEDLLGMADRATSLDHQRLYLSALDFLADRGQTLLQHFRAAYVQRFDDNVAAVRQGRRHDHSIELNELRLIDTDDFERDLAVGKLSARAAFSCANQLTALDHRLAVLLQLPRMSQDDNPLHPRALFASMLRAVNELEGSEPLALTLLQELERQTSEALPRIYNDLNRSLADCGVLPKIPLDLGRNGSAPSSREGSAERDRDAESAAVIPPGADAVFAQLARAIHSVAGTPEGASSATPAQPGSEQATPIGAAQLMNALTSLQQGRAGASGLPGLAAVQIDPASAQVLQQLRSTLLAGSTNPVDAMTIDIVAMLFDAIFNDPDLPASVRAEIAKLQIPVLKVALMDKTLFSNKRHPTRRLIDVIANAGLGLSEADEPRLLQKIRSIVDDVVAGFETDVHIFATQVQKLEDFLQDEEARARSRTTEVVSKLEQRDRQELATSRVGTEIESRIHRRSVPTLVGDFLSRHWRLVMIRSYVESGELAAPWVEAVRSMDELLWSVEPKQGPEDRNRLLTTLPDLLKRLRSGLEAVGLGDAWDPFFAHLIRLHMGAMRKDIPEDEYQSPARNGANGSSGGAPIGGNGAGFDSWAPQDPPSRSAHQAARASEATGPQDDHLAARPVPGGGRLGRVPERARHPQLPAAQLAQRSAAASTCSPTARARTHSPSPPPASPSTCARARRGSSARTG